MKAFCLECFSEAVEVSGGGRCRTCRACGAVAERNGEAWRITRHGSRHRAAAALPVAAVAPSSYEFCLSCYAADRLEDLADGGQVCHTCGTVMSRCPDGCRTIARSTATPFTAWSDDLSGRWPGGITIHARVHNPAGVDPATVEHVLDSFRAALVGIEPGERKAIARHWSVGSGGHLIIGRDLRCPNGRPAAALAHLGSTRIQVDPAEVGRSGYNLTAVLGHELRHSMGDADEGVCNLVGEETAWASKYGRFA